MTSSILALFIPLSIVILIFIYDSQNHKGKSEKKEAIEQPIITTTSTDYKERKLVDGIKLTKAELGKAGWLILHAMSVKYPLQPTEKDKDRMRAFLKYFSEQYPCSECANHFVKYLQVHPPLLECRDDISRYLCQLHNEVNKFLKKPIFDCDTIYDVWGGDCGCNVKMEVPFKCDLPLSNKN